MHSVHLRHHDRTGGRVLVTGAAGRVGGVLRDGLGEQFALRLLDLSPMTARPGEEVVQADVRCPEQVAAAMEGCTAVVHLAGIPREAAFEDLLDHNIRGTYHVLEAARSSPTCRRVVLSSTNHVTGFYPVGQTITPDAPPRPDSLYAASKAYGEVLGRMYHEKHGLEVVAIRIGTCAPRPTLARHLHTWISPRDMTQLVLRCIQAPDVGWLLVYGTSANRRSYWDDREAWGRIDYVPQDSADGIAGLTPDGADRFQGGTLATPEPR